MTVSQMSIDAAAGVAATARTASHSPLKAVRLHRGLTATGLAGAVGMDPAQLDLIEQQSELGAPLWTQWQALAHALNVPVDAVR